MIRRRRVLLLALIPLLLPLACGSEVAHKDAEYPDVKVRSMIIELRIKDSRKEVVTPITEPNKLYQDEVAAYPQALPEEFEQAAIDRLGKLTSDGGLNLQANVLVERADVTFSNDYRGDMTRYDVTLAIRVTTPGGALLHEGKGQSWQELPHKEATPEEMRRTFLSASLNAFDQYFAAKSTLERINSQIERYLKTHPDEAR